MDIRQWGWLAPRHPHDQSSQRNTRCNQMHCACAGKINKTMPQLEIVTHRTQPATAAYPVPGQWINETADHQRQDQSRRCRCPAAQRDDRHQRCQHRPWQMAQKEGIGQRGYVTPRQGTNRLDRQLPSQFPSLTKMGSIPRPVRATLPADRPIRPRQTVKQNRWPNTAKPARPTAASPPRAALQARSGDIPAVPTSTKPAGTSKASAAVNTYQYAGAACNSIPGTLVVLYCASCPSAED